MDIYPEAMSKEELEAELGRLKEKLVDVEDTFNFNLAHTAAHLSSSLVAEHEEELNELREKIARIEKLLGERPGG